MYHVVGSYLLIYKCHTFKTTCSLGNTMQAYIALATLRGYDFKFMIYSS